MDELDVTLTEEDEIPERGEYTVVAENGLFKNGQQYDKGDTIQLDKKTADQFKKLEEIK